MKGSNITKVMQEYVEKCEQLKDIEQAIAHIDAFPDTEGSLFLSNSERNVGVMHISSAVAKTFLLDMKHLIEDEVATVEKKIEKAEKALDSEE